MCDVLLVHTGHDTFTIHNLQKVWVEQHFFIYRLMYTDEVCTECIFWSFNKKVLENCKQKLLRAYYSHEPMVNL